MAWVSPRQPRLARRSIQMVVRRLWLTILKSIPPEALALQGKTAVANAKRAYALFGDIVGDERFRAQIARGARPQRLLWGSTSTKNPNYSDTLYVDELIGPETVNTMPPATAELFRDHGRVHATLSEGQDEAAAVLAEIAGV
ncbi:MAG: hypothetical protein IIC62_04960, partial [Proteobacteria bacterium]|nr:hypothetical protein [Pseudomonadota bacterium]